MSPRILRILSLALVLLLPGIPSLSLAQTAPDLKEPQAAADKASKEVDSANADAQKNLPNNTVKAKEDALDQAAQKNDDTPANAPGKAAAQKAEDDARKAADDTQDSFKDKNADDYRNALVKRREARKKLKKALDELRKVLQTRRQSPSNDNSDAEKAVQKATKKLGEAEKKPERTTTGMVTPQEKSMPYLAAAGTIKVESAGTGETIGHVADLKITNQTDTAISFVIPAMVLESSSGKNQHYACPHPQTVEIGPNSTATVPIDGVCLVRSKPPVGNGVTGDLVANDGNPKSAKDPACKLADPVARDLVNTAQAYYHAADELQKQGKLKKLPYTNPQKQKDIVVQWGLWTDPKVAESTGGKPATKEDLKKVVYKQVEEKGPMTPAVKKKVDEGITSIFETVQLTTAKAKEIKQPDVFADVQVTGPSGKEETPGAQQLQPQDQSTQEKPKDQPKQEGQANPLNPGALIGGDGPGIVDDPEVQAQIEAAKKAKEYVNRTQEKLKKAKAEFDKKKDDGMHQNPETKKIEDDIDKLQKAKDDPKTSDADKKKLEEKIKDDKSKLNKIERDWLGSKDGKAAGKDLKKVEDEANQAKEEYKPYKDLDKYTEEAPHERVDEPGSNNKEAPAPTEPKKAGSGN